MSDFGYDLPVWAIPVVTVLVIIGAVSGVTLGWMVGSVPIVVVVVAVATWAVLRHPRVRALREARQDATRMTAQTLRPLQERGHRVLDAHTCAMPSGAGELDHLVIGPSGIYAVASRNWPRRVPLRTRGPDLYRGPESQRKLLRETARGAERTGQVLSERLGRPLTVTPILAIYGSHVPWKALVIRGVRVLSGKRLRRHIHRRDRQLSTVEIERVTVAARDALPARVASSPRGGSPDSRAA